MLINKSCKFTIYRKTIAFLIIFLGQIRNVNIHKDSMRFRRNIERIGIMAYELSKELHYKAVEIQTPLEKRPLRLPDQLVSVLFYVLDSHILVF
jgi:uracil phosphoribosyltransferase